MTTTAAASGIVMSSKEILCVLGDRRRPVQFTTKDGNDVVSAVKAVREIFRDAIPDSSRLFLQIKKIFWGGEFTDIRELDDIPDKSVVRVVIEHSSPKVSYYYSIMIN